MEMIGKRIRKLRIQNHVTQAQLAKELNVSESAISNYEKGFRTVSIDALIKIADFFGVDVNFIVGRNCRVHSDTKDLIVSDEEIDFIKELRKARCYKNVIIDSKKFVKIIENRTKGYDVEIEDVGV